MEGPKKAGRMARSLTDAMSLGLSMVAAVALGYLGGQWLDGYFGTGMVLRIVGLMLGVATGFKMIWDRTSKKKN